MILANGHGSVEELIPVDYGECGHNDTQVEQQEYPSTGTVTAKVYAECFVTELLNRIHGQEKKIINKSGLLLNAWFNKEWTEVFLLFKNIF